jgi:hypothetical protein
MEFSIATKVEKIGLSRCTNGSSIIVANVVFFVATRSVRQSTLSIMLVAPSCEQDS